MMHVFLILVSQRDCDTPGRNRVPPETYPSHTDQGVTYAVHPLDTTFIVETSNITII